MARGRHLPESSLRSAERHTPRSRWPCCRARDNSSAAPATRCSTARRSQKRSSRLRSAHPTAHATAPLRRLVDRYVLGHCLAISPESPCLSGPLRLDPLSQSHAVDRTAEPRTRARIRRPSSRSPCWQVARGRTVRSRSQSSRERSYARLPAGRTEHRSDMRKRPRTPAKLVTVRLVESRPPDTITSSSAAE